MKRSIAQLHTPITLGLLGGIVGGLAMAMWMMLKAESAGQGFWTPVSMCMASFVYRDWAKEMMGTMMQMKMHGEATSSSIEGIHGVVGIMLHMVMSMALGVGFALVLALTRFGRSLGFAGTVAAGVMFGLVVWVVMEFGLLPLVNSLMANNIRDMVGSWVFLVGHLVFGLVLGIAVGWQYRDQPLPHRLLRAA